MGVLKAISFDEIKARGAIIEADVQRLRRAFYEDGSISAQEAEAILALNVSCGEQVPAWADCLIEMLTDYVVNQAVPEGYVTVENADWLLARIGAGAGAEVANKAALDLLINVLDKSRWSPQSLVTFALRQVRQAVVDGTGAARTSADATAGVVSEADVEMLRRILYAFGGDGNVAITRPEAEILFEINDATACAENADSWRDLFVKAIANCVLTSSGYTVPGREQALAREAWLERRGDITPGTILKGVLSSYRAQSPEERAIARLERQKIEIVTGAEVSVADAGWLAECIGRDGRRTPNEDALIAFLKADAADFHPDLQAMLDKVATAA
jgi:hypothetical protein